MSFSQALLQRLNDDIAERMENNHTGVTVQLLSAKWMEVIFSSGLLRTAIFAKPGYMVCNFLSSTVAEIEEQILLCKSNPDSEVDIPFLSLRELQDLYADRGIYPFESAQGYFLKYFEICENNALPINANTFNSFMIFYEMSLPESRIARSFTEEEKNYIKSAREQGHVDSAISRFMSDRLTGEENDMAYFCKCGENERPIINQVCQVLIYQVLNSGHIFKRCELCGKWFVPQKSDEKYCLRKSSLYPTKNCKQAAKYAKQLSRERSSEASKIYKSINTMKTRKLNFATNPEEIERLRRELYDFRDESAKWKERIKSGETSEQEYIDWLNSFKVRKHKK